MMVAAVKVTMVVVMVVPSRWNHNDSRRAVPSMVVVMMVVIELSQFDVVISQGL